MRRDGRHDYVPGMDMRTPVLDQVIDATRQAEASEVFELLRALTDEATLGTVTFSKNLTETMRQAIENLDAMISKQLAAVMHAEKFKALEASWRGLHYLVINGLTGRDLEIRLMNASKRDLARDLMTTGEFVLDAAAYNERVVPEEEELLEVLADEFALVVADIRTTLRQTNERLEAHFAEMEAMRSAPPPVVDLDDDQLLALHEIFWAAGDVPI